MPAMPQRLAALLLSALRLFLLISPFASPCSSFGAQRPNILLIYSDDHGWADLGVQGADADIRTPHLDQLARDGVRFAQGYVTAPQCTPSRAGVITGLYQNRFGVEHNGIPMRAEVLTLPERLKSAGYVTGISGKWHLNYEDRRGQGGGVKNFVRQDLGPWAQGFDEYFEGFLQDYNASHALDGTAFPDAPRKVRDPRCRVVIQTEAALAFLKRREIEARNQEPGSTNKAKPWFHYLAYMAPHVPMEQPAPWYSRTPAHLPHERRSALALLAAIDEGVGRIRARIREMGQEQNTLIFFIGDNGAPQGSSWDGSINLPMRGQKGMLSEGGIRVPFLAAWPGRIPAGLVFQHPVHSLDVAATAVKAAGATVSADAKAAAALDGADLLPHLTGSARTPPHETLYWRWMAQAAVLEHPYKLIVLGGKQRLLFDLTTPEGESADRDLIKQKPEIAARLEAKLQAWTAQLTPPGLPGSLSDHHVQLFAGHGISAAASGTRPAAASSASDPLQGWIARNGTLAIQNDALVLTPAADLPGNARPFLTRTDLKLDGPVTATLRLRARTGAPSSITWRTKTASFAPEQSAAFDWPAGSEFSEIKVKLPEKSRVIHLRITPGKATSGVEVQFIELSDAKGHTQSFRFAPTP